MFDFFRKHMRVMQFALVLLILPSFVFFGIHGYSRMGEGGNATVAKVAGQNITQAELDAALRGERLPEAGGKIDRVVTQEQITNVPDSTQRCGGDPSNEGDLEARPQPLEVEAHAQQFE